MKDKKTEKHSESGSENTSPFFELEKRLEQTLSEMKPVRQKIAADLVRACIRLVEEDPGTLNLKICSTVLRELRYSFKIFSPHRYTPKITMFGSARVVEKSPLYELARDFAAEAVRRKFFIITGGGPGLMAAGNEGAAKGGFGLNIKLPVEQTANPFIDSEKMLIHYKYFFIRKLFLVKEASAFAFFPGGFGTFDEAFEVLTLIQTGKTNLIPIVMIETKGFGFWEELMKTMREVVLTRKFISESDFNIFKVFNDPKKALDHIEHFYSVYHSMRYVQDKLVLRIKKKPTAKLLDRMSKEFSHLSKGEHFKVGGPLPEESNEPEIKDLPRVVFPFDKRDFGELRRLVDFINEHVV